MRLRAFSSIGELRLFGNALHPSQPGFDSRKDFLDIKVANEDLSDLAVAFIQRVGADASEELIEKCRELVEFADKYLEPSDDQRKAFIKACEEKRG